MRLSDLPPHIRKAIKTKAPKQPRTKRGESPLVVSLCAQIAAAGLPEPVKEFRFHPVRLWRFDLSWPDRMIAAEVDGGIWTSGRHTRGAGYIADCEKLNAALLLGWRVFRFPGDHVKNGTACKMLRDALAFWPGSGVD